MLAINRMTLDVPGLSEHQARDLAQRVAAGLAATTGLSDGTDAPSIRLDLPAETQTGDMAALARRIVAATLRSMVQAGAGAP
jgi:hypothetical protein